MSKSSPPNSKNLDLFELVKKRVKESEKLFVAAHNLFATAATRTTTTELIQQINIRSKKTNTTTTARLNKKEV